ncbi:MAG: hypothetical protein US22_C0058G0005 [candidate division TM6 bacterium GW2011_GWF2_36_6]|nr:MAG: hypothetical protein US22_C0058G0005 [candidate division TM6 bacterium GW2011_GWF2_36_6]
MKNLKTKIYKYFSNYITSFLQAQLVVSIISIPILVGWGLPTSLMTFVGNLIFAPVLIAFLIISSLIFFTQILRIPNQLLISILKIISHSWISFLELGKRSWLYGFYKPHTAILILIPIFSFGILYLIRFRSTLFKTITMATLLFSVVLGLTIFPYFAHKHTTKCFADGKLMVDIDENFKVKFVDNGFFNKHQSVDKLVDYDIRQFLIKNTGNINIDSLVLLRPGYRTFKAGSECCSKLNIRELSLPYFDGSKFKKHAWHEYFNLKKTAEEKGVNILRFNYAINNRSF